MWLHLSKLCLNWRATLQSQFVLRAVFSVSSQTGNGGSARCRRFVCVLDCRRGIFKSRARYRRWDVLLRQERSLFITAVPHGAAVAGLAELGSLLVNHLVTNARQLSGLCRGLRVPQPQLRFLFERRLREKSPLLVSDDLQRNLWIWIMRKFPSCTRLCLRYVNKGKY